ncbi:unnamed protein product [Rotaria sp. Silwood1]|nr:unnamed protein product [Rotaria sp. Silwood1]CAF3537867.1 unnamed protein product [Rotaria sp. Silwood1]CAF3701152.1 unnamed protein product [Rotaria sp. Silwood1]CAF4748307.1 unnamed protein product [Rotaria sp. Silwood1]CAF4848690.1 unnamed protein product [Rotaria sp. Silwood1]
MYFECLANELLLDLFQYIDVIDLFRAFYDLNTRLNELLFTKLTLYNLDFRSVSKYDFDHVCQQYLPLIINQIISLHLSDNEETPNLSKILLSYGFTINKFINLKSLSLYNIQSYDIFNQLIIQCHHLPYLTHLNMIKCFFNYHENEIESLMNNIWNLSTLTHCIVDQIISRKIRLTDIHIISSSIKYLTLEKITCDFKDLSHLFKYTTYLQRISINLLYGFPNQQLQYPIESIISLKILYHGYIDMLRNLFQNLPNLIYLKLETFDIYCNGYEWENILVSDLSKIKFFNLKMNLNFPNHNHINQQANELLDTFRTYFWLVEHQWYVRCDWDPLNIFSYGILYTLPYNFNDCFYFDTISSKSTCPFNTDYWSYDRVLILSHKNPENDLSKDLILFSARFSQIRYLKISFPFDEKFWSCIPLLNRLISINIIFLSTDHAYSQLQDLLNRTVHLYSLKLSNTKNVSMKFFTITSPSVRRLDLITKFKSSIRYFNADECSSLVNNSPFIQQCEVLLIGIKYRSNIVEFINALPNLRSLICNCKDDEYNVWSSSSTNDELIEWLKNRLPSTYMISRDEKRPYLIRLWIDR